MSVVALRPVEDVDLDVLFEQLRDLVPARPLYARAASDNSLRRLLRCGWSLPTRRR